MFQENPLSIKVLGELDENLFKADIKEIFSTIKEDDDNRQGWINNCNKIRKLIDNKDKRKNKPWKKASEICVPLIKKMLRRWKPVLYNLVALADPVCAFYAGSAQTQDKEPEAERFFDWLIKVHMEGTMDELQYLVDNIGTYGSGYLGVSWDYKTETQSRVAVVKNLFPKGIPQDPNAIMQALADQYDVTILNERIRRDLTEAAQKILQGAQFVRITSTQVVSNKPKITSYTPMSVIVPTKSNTAHNAEYVALVTKMSPNDMKHKVADGFFNKEAVDLALSHIIMEDEQKIAKNVYTDSAPGEVFQNKILQEAGVTTSVSKDITVYQVYCKLDYNGDGIKERVVLWGALGKGEVPIILALFPYAFSIPYWPVFRFDFEKAKKGPYTNQGIGHLLQQIQKLLNKQQRAKDDAIDIQLAPVFQMRTTAGLRPQNVKWGPGKIISVQQPGDFSPVEKSPFNLHEYLGAENQLNAMAEGVIGNLLNDLQTTGRKLERRTASEVAQVGAQSQAMSSMDSASFQATLRLVWQSVWQLWMDLGPREIYFFVTGKYTAELFKKADYNKNYQLMPTGTPGNTDTQRQLSDGMSILQLAMQDQTGSFNLPAIFQWVVKRIDDRLADIALVPQAQQAYIQTLQQAAALIEQGELPPDINGAIMTGQQKQEGE